MKLKEVRRKAVRLSRRSRFAQAIATLCMALVVFVLVKNSSRLPSREEILNKLNLHLSPDTLSIANAVSVLLLLIALFSVLSRQKKNPYFDSRPPVTPERTSVGESVSRLEEVAASLSEKVATFDLMKDSSFKDSILNEVRTVFSVDAVQSIRQRYGVEKIEEIFAETKARKRILNDAFCRRATISLVFGCGIGILGILALIYFSVSNPPGPLWNSYLQYFAPRISAVIIVELLAWFFLSNYRQCLHELKYVENDITNWQTREAAIHAAVATGSESELAKIISVLLMPDRNTARGLESEVRPNAKNHMDRGVTIEAISQIANLAQGFS